MQIAIELELLLDDMALLVASSDSQNMEVAGMVENEEGENRT